MEKIETLSFQISLILYFSASALFILELCLKSKNFGRLPVLKTLIAFSFQTLSIILRSVRAGHPPMATLFETFSLLSWIIVLLYLLQVRSRVNHKSLGAFIIPIVFIMNAIGITSVSEIVPLQPALQSIWFFIHVPLCFFGYACLTIAFCSSIIYFIQDRNLKIKNLTASFQKLPSLMDADDLCYKMVTIGFTLLTVGIITGSFWAQSAWGSYWQWDPKETWSLITWLLYAIYLHTRLIGGWRGKRTNLVIIIGFICVVITFLGVNYIIGGLHTYI